MLRHLTGDTPAVVVARPAVPQAGHEYTPASGERCEVSSSRSEGVAPHTIRGSPGAQWTTALSRTDTVWPTAIGPPHLRVGEDVRQMECVRTPTGPAHTLPSENPPRVRAPFEGACTTRVPPPSDPSPQRASVPECDKDGRGTRRSLPAGVNYALPGENVPESEWLRVRDPARRAKNPSIGEPTC